MEFDQQTTEAHRDPSNGAQGISTADKKFVVVLNKRHEANELLSALGHVAVGVAGGRPNPDDLSLVTYIDADGVEYPDVSDWPFIVLRGGGGQMATFRNRLRDRGLPAVAYLSTMRTGGSEAQQELTARTRTEDLEVVAVATFGSREEI